MAAPWKKPYRASNAVSQTFNDGLLSVYGVTDGAAPGCKPVKKPTLKVTLCFDERRVGIERFYQSAQAQARIERVLRVPESATVIKAQDIVTVTGSDLVYRVEQVQSVPDVRPACLDLALSCVRQDAAAEGGGGNG